MKKKDKVHKVMGEFKRGKLRSGSKSGPKVKDRKQAVAIAMSEAGKSRAKGDGSKPKMGLKGALIGGKRPGGRDSAGKREKRLEGKPL